MTFKSQTKTAISFPSSSTPSLVCQCADCSVQLWDAFRWELPSLPINLAPGEQPPLSLHDLLATLGREVSESQVISGY